MEFLEEKGSSTERRRSITSPNSWNQKVIDLMVTSQTCPYMGVRREGPGRWEKTVEKRKVRWWKLEYWGAKTYGKQGSSGTKWDRKGKKVDTGECVRGGQVINKDLNRMEKGWLFVQEGKNREKEEGGGRCTLGCRSGSSD